MNTSGITMMSFISAVLSAYVASRKNRNALGWGVFGFLIPVVSLVLILISPTYCEKCGKPIRKKDGEHICKSDVSLNNKKINKSKTFIIIPIIILSSAAWFYFNNINSVRYIDPKSFSETFANTFVNTMDQMLDNPITKDQDHVYSFGKIIPDADLKTFVILGDGYGKDKNSMFYLDKIIPNADPKTYVYLGSGYGLDKDRMYYEAKIVQNVSRESFVPLEFGYGKDKNFVFSGGTIVEGADPNTFKLLNNVYTRDANNIYCGDKRLEIADVPSFDALKIDISVLYARDKSSLFYDCEIVEGVNPEKFEYLDDFYFRNMSGVYYYDDYLELIESADPNSFELLGDFYAKDNNHTYRFGKIED